MGVKVDLAGQKFGKLTVVGFHGKTPDNMVRLWDCQCECGGSVVVPTSRLRQGITQSCGCAVREALISRNTRHGKSKTRLYLVWQAMMNRCNNPNNQAYGRYGGREITVDPAWHDYARFESDMGVPPVGMTLERKDTDGPYSKSNCRWATQKEQQSNRRDNVWLVLASGVKVTLSEAARQLGVSRRNVTYHLDKYGEYQGAKYVVPSKED